jgi:transcriptional regulator with XRE-family HTH domain
MDAFPFHWPHECIFRRRLFIACILLAKKINKASLGGALATPPDKFDFSVLRRLREQHEMTLADLSEASGVSVPVISKLERNQQSAELDTLYRLGRAFGMSATDLLALTESPLAHRGRRGTASLRPVQVPPDSLRQRRGPPRHRPGQLPRSPALRSTTTTPRSAGCSRASSASPSPTRNACSRPASACNSTPSSSTPTSPLSRLPLPHSPPPKGQTLLNQTYPIFDTEHTE